MVVDKEESYQASGLAGWVMDKTESWRDHYTSNYEQKFDEYYRIFRGIWAAEDKSRGSERSKLISPATQQAVESAVSEVEEATFGHGRWFDIRDDHKDQDNKDIAYLREQLYEDFAYTKTRKAVAECILNSAIYGTGLGELVIEEVNEMKPATQPIMEGALQAVGVNIQPRTVVKLRSILPQNFLIDPVASSIEDAVGVIIDEFVPIHSVHQAMNAGIYKKVSLSGSEEDTDLEADKELSIFPTDKVRITKYYGLVPKHLFEAEVNDDEEDPEKGMADLADKDNGLSDEPEEYIEAIVVLAQGGKVLKVEENPYMMQDRPLIAFSWDVVPGRFWGRGIVEKAYNSQKALDAELRARIDALALTVHPMIAMDATRIPRGSKFEVRPGKAILTNGNPAEIMMPFKFGNLDQVTFAQADALQRMVQTATGAVDSAGIAGSINGEATAAGISMSLGAIIKRHKRTLINFQECFLIPLVEKSAWRYMQFDPENYPVQDFKFVASSSLGVIAREYEVTQLVQLLQTLGQDSPIYPMLVTAVIDNMGLSNREELIEQIQASMEPDPQAQQMAQMQQELQMSVVKGQADALAGQAQKYMADAQHTMVQAQLEPDLVKAKLVAALSNNLKAGVEDDIEFRRRAKMAELMLKEKELDQNMEIVQMQTESKKRDTANDFVGKLSQELDDGS